MTKQEVLAQLGQWEKAQAHDKIVSAILSLPVEQRDYRLSCALAREYNMLGRHQEAKDLLENLAQEGRRDPNWFFHYGFSLHALGRYAEAKGAFQQLLKMVPKQPNILALIHSCDVHLEKQALAKAYSDGLDLDEDKTLDYILKGLLHGAFGVPDQVEEDCIYIPAWELRIYPEVTELEKDSVVLTFNLECPRWDRDINEVSAAKAQNPAMALNVICSGFVLSLGNAVSQLAQKQKGLPLETEFAGHKHRWQVYRGNVLSGGETPKLEDFELYWKLLKDDLAQRIGNQKLCVVKIAVSKNGDVARGECRLNGVRIESLSRKVEAVAAQWPTKAFGLQRQFFLLEQEEETYLPGAPKADQLDQWVQETVRLYGAVHSKEEADALPEKLKELCGGDATLAKELQIYLPMGAAENAYRKLAYPETLTFDFGGRKETVFRSQLATFHPMQRALYWALQYKVFGEETESLYHSLISASPLYQFIQKQSLEGKPVQDGMGVSMTISVPEDFELR